MIILAQNISKLQQKSTLPTQSQYYQLIDWFTLSKDIKVVLEVFRTASNSEDFLKVVLEQMVCLLEHILLLEYLLMLSSA